MSRRINLVILTISALVTAGASWVYHCLFRSNLETFGWSFGAWWDASTATLMFSGLSFCLVAAVTAMTLRARFAAGRCAKCGYDLTNLKSPRCPECGGSTSSRRRMLTGEHRIMWSVATVVTGWLIGCAVGEAWLLVDEAFFVRESNRTPAVSNQRGRWWPAGNASLMYEPGIGFRARD